MRPLLALALACCSCGRYYSDLGSAALCPSALGIEVYSESDCPPWSRAADISERVDDLARAVAGHAETSPERLAGWAVAFGVRPSCGAGGCAWLDDHRIEVTCDAPCPEATVLGHELFHAALGRPDARHEDPRWDTLYPVLLRAAQARDCAVIPR